MRIRGRRRVLENGRDSLSEASIRESFDQNSYLVLLKNIKKLWKCLNLSKKIEVFKNEEFLLKNSLK